MNEVEEVYNASSTGALLGLGGAMLRRYAASYEELSGSTVAIHPREGRLFTQSQVDTLLKARTLVTKQGLSVRAAMQIALSPDADMALRGAERRSDGLQDRGLGKDAVAPNEAFSEMLKNAVQEGNRELVEEMRLLRASLESNSNPNYNSNTQAAGGVSPMHGPFVKFALWLERLLKK